jgi:hypothetical protein
MLESYSNASIQKDLFPLIGWRDDLDLHRPRVANVDGQFSRVSR